MKSKKPGAILKHHFEQEVADVGQAVGLSFPAIAVTNSWPRRALFPVLSAAAVAAFVMGSTFFDIAGSSLSVAFAAADERNHISASIRFPSFYWLPFF